MKPIRNDSGYTLDEANEILAGAIELEYAGYKLRVHPVALRETRESVESHTDQEKRQLARSVDITLRQTLRKFKRRPNSCSKKTHDDFVADVLLWEALKDFRPVVH